MDPTDALERLGGTASRCGLLQLTSRRALKRAVETNEVVRVGRDRYALPAADQARWAAMMLNGFVTHVSAAMYWGWEVRFAPTLPQVAVPRGRTLRRTAAAEVRA